VAEPLNSTGTLGVELGDLPPPLGPGVGDLLRPRLGPGDLLRPRLGPGELLRRTSPHGS
jgi:hypothetical protein